MPAILVSHIRGIHTKLARDVYPNGGLLHCLKCGREQHFTTEDAAQYLKSGWPRCCGLSMRSVKSAPNKRLQPTR